MRFSATVLSVVIGIFVPESSFQAKQQQQQKRNLRRVPGEFSIAFAFQEFCRTSPIDASSRSCVAFFPLPFPCLSFRLLSPCLRCANLARSPLWGSGRSVRLPQCIFGLLFLLLVLSFFNSFKGKSTITIQFCEGHYVDAYNPTIENTFHKVMRFNNEDFEVDIVDTAGQVR
jgi:hypothetical protein